jgi:hypothetical protein
VGVRGHEKEGQSPTCSPESARLLRSDLICVYLDGSGHRRAGGEGLASCDLDKRSFGFEATWPTGFVRRCPPTSALLHPLLSTSRYVRSGAFPCGTRAADLHKHGGRYWDRTSDLFRVRHRKHVRRRPPVRVCPGQSRAGIAPDTRGHGRTGSRRGTRWGTRCGGPSGPPSPGRLPRPVTWLLRTGRRRSPAGGRPRCGRAPGARNRFRSPIV